MWHFVDEDVYKELQKDLMVLNYWMMKLQMKLHLIYNDTQGKNNFVFVYPVMNYELLLSRKN